MPLFGDYVQGLPHIEGVKVLDPFEFDLFDIDTKEQKRRRSPK